jgi:DNA polymerase IV
LDTMDAMSNSSRPAVKSSGSQIGLEELPPIYILSFQLDIDELHELEGEVLGLGANLTYDAEEARIFLGRLAQKKRAAFELRSKGVWTEEAVNERAEPPAKHIRRSPPIEQTASLKRGASEIDSASDTTSVANSRPTSPVSPETAPRRPPLQFPDLRKRILVIQLDWIKASVEQNQLLPFDEYLVYDARITPKPEGATTPKTSPKPVTYGKAAPEASVARGMPPSAPPSNTINTILARARAEAPSAPPAAGHPTAHQTRRRLNQPALTHPPHPPKLRRTTTLEFEELESRSLPEPPHWVRDHILYSCQRSTPLHPPNAPFIAELEKIKIARLLTLDEVGVRAYATSIAAIAAYPYVLKSAAEVLRLPGCDSKIAQLWSEFRDSAEDESERFLPTARELEKDEHLRHLKLFYEIWGVGADTARKFYFDRGWKDIDDVVEFGWTGLNRVQQIGVKYYDEFQVKIPRKEVEEIREVVLRHARAARGVDEAEWGGTRDVEAVIVGGYRRGKEESGDVDIILSHRDKELTENLVVDVVGSLEREGWITHTLTLHTTTSDRGQQTLPYRTEGGGHRFDSLDKALCVWQDPEFEGMGVEGRKNPNIHRRVDIIVSSWRTVACAILGWSGGNTFQRDIRRYVKRAKGWKFDSSGVRDRVSGHVLDFESPKNGDDADTWLDRERRLMNGLGIGWRPPGERCTG